MNKWLQRSTIFILGLLVGIPLLLLVALSIGKGYHYPNILPESYNLEGYKYLATGYPRLKVITFQSVKLSTIVAIIAVSLGMLAGIGLSGPDFIGKKLVKKLMLLPLLIPMVSVAMGLHMMFIKLHLANKLVGVILIQTVVSLPYAVLIFSDLFKLIGDGWYEQGSLYGAIGIKKFMYITFPLLSDGIISAFGICFIVSFSQYFVTLLIGGGRIKTFATEMFPFMNSGDQLLSASFSVVFLLINVVMLLVVEVIVKSFVRRGYHSIEG